MTRINNNRLLFIAPIFLIFSCGTHKNKNKEETKIVEESKVPVEETTVSSYSSYFEASGIEPFWSIELTEDEVTLKELDKETITMDIGQNKSEKETERTYKFSNAAVDYTLTVSKKECIHLSSGKTSSYTVSITRKIKEGKDLESLDGCGDYKIQKQLHDIWVLEEMKGKIISSKEFPKEFPRMEIRAAEESFIGFTGCNEMFGKITVQDGRFIFSNIGSTKMLCEGVNEAKFLEAMGVVDHYQLKNNKLLFYLSIGGTLIFKKVD